MIKSASRTSSWFNRFRRPHCPTPTQSIPNTEDPTANCHYFRIYRLFSSCGWKFGQVAAKNVSIWNKIERTKRTFCGYRTKSKTKQKNEAKNVVFFVHVRRSGWNTIRSKLHIMNQCHFLQLWWAFSQNSIENPDFAQCRKMTITLNGEKN